ncbi:MAG: coproporphyrinogen III oxidase [Candidatus Babeliales bacterium]
MNYDYSIITKSLYIHWPFCPYKCHFCPFVAIAGQDKFMQQYHDALKKEIISYSKSVSQKQALDTIFIGGGTPSTWPDDMLLDMSDTLKDVFILNEKTEISIEVNPGTVRIEQLAVWEQAGINRLSIGVQSLKDSVLSNLNRKQSNADVFWLLNHASKMFDNISVDLILGLPEVSEQEWKDLLAQAISWPIKHISVYFLTVHEETPLYFRVKKNELSLQTDDHMIDLYQWTVAYLADHGFEQYEISNFAKDGKRSRHNSIYWERKPYKGFGLGACSFDGSSRFQNQKNLMKYMHAISSDQDHVQFRETLTPAQVHLEKVMLGLRKSEGIAIETIIDHLNDEQKKLMLGTLAYLQENKFLQQRNDRIILTPAGLGVQNDIAARLSW